MNNAGFLSIESVRENQLANLSKQIDNLREENDRLEDINEELMEERNRLNNIINELEKYLEQEIKEYKENGYDILEIRRVNLWLTGCYDEDKNILEKLQELKGSESNE